ncbi:NPC intracellular cholesterol transporter 2 [Linepithema humile]|uniref:NPC intracellular cholesterol transporter 2 n=1 Tax=Linepithema humile TaxID=83485 RepID=UPI0006235B91|nr:PREDICTED: epididymal secretory protein E1-like [Linepithema humile]
MKVLVSACIIAAFCVVESLQSTPHNPCKDGPAPKDLRVVGCETTPCNIIRGSTMKAEWDFTAINDAKALTPRVRVTLGGVTIPYRYPEQDACKSLVKGDCPLEKDEQATYGLNMPIEKSYPPVALKIEFALLDENEKVHVCFSINGKVTS